MNPLLAEILAYRRPAYSKTEERFVRHLIDSVPGIQRDEYGNRLFLREGSRTMIAVHTDTVHRSEGMQRIQERKGVVSLHPKERVSNCLGADDGAGVYAALRMIQAEAPVSVIFHRAEEIGGKGSDYLAYHYPHILEKFDICLSLDRRGAEDVIVEQWNGPCCSLEFALGLAEALGLGHKPGSGTFTDSANYTEIIPECSNLGIGYACEHRPQETLAVDYLECVIERLCKVDWASLPVVRDPAVDFWSDGEEEVEWWDRPPWWERVSQNEEG